MNNNDLKSLLKEVVQEAIAPLQIEISAMKTDITSMKSDIESLKSGQVELNQMTRALLDRQEEADAKLEVLTMDVHELRGEVTQIKEVMATKDDISSIERRLDYQIGRIAKTEEQLYILKMN